MIRRSSCKSAYDLQSPPNKREKNSTMPPRPEQRRSCHILYDGSDGLVLNGWERYTEIGKRSQNTMPPLSRVPSTADQNYIILAPLNPGSQVGLLPSPTLELCRRLSLCLLGPSLACASALSSVISKCLLEHVPFSQVRPVSLGRAFTIFLFFISVFISIIFTVFPRGL